MTYKDFVKASIMTLQSASFEELKGTIVGEFLSFEIIEDTAITKEILAEKACDYFEKLELKTGKNFSKQLEVYLEDIDSIVGRKVAKAPQAKKKESAELIIIPRARKYYDKAVEVKSNRSISFRSMIDYTRIMMCLYMAIINNDYKEIMNLDYSLECLNIDRIISSMKTEKAAALGVIKKKRFDIKDLYCSDTGTFIITIIMLNVIKDESIVEEYNNE